MTKHKATNGLAKGNATLETSNGKRKQVVFLDAETMDLPSLDTSSLDERTKQFRRRDYASSTNSSRRRCRAHLKCPMLCKLTKSCYKPKIYTRPVSFPILGVTATGNEQYRP
jgi:hypothetical protein